MATLTTSTVCACSGVTPGASCAPMTLAALTARVSVCTMVVLGIVSGNESTGREVVDEDVEVVLAMLAVVCVGFAWVLLVAGW